MADRSALDELSACDEALLAVGLEDVERIGELLRARGTALRELVRAGAGNVEAFEAAFARGQAIHGRLRDRVSEDRRSLDRLRQIQNVLPRISPEKDVDCIG